MNIEEKREVGNLLKMRNNCIMKFFSISILIWLTLLGCSKPEKPEIQLTKRWHNEKGVLIKEQEFINDTIKHGIYRFFFPNGQIKDSVRFIQNKMHGKRYVFYENGNLHVLANYNMGKERNGIRYKQDGRIDCYKAFTYTSELVFYLYYDSVGHLKKHDGSIIHSWVLDDNYPLGEELSIELLVANPPNYKTEVFISEFDVDKNKKYNESAYTPDEFNRIVYQVQQNPERDLIFLHKAILLNESSQTTLHDSLFILISKDGGSASARSINNLF